MVRARADARSRYSTGESGRQRCDAGCKALEAAHFIRRAVARRIGRTARLDAPRPCGNVGAPVRLLRRSGRFYQRNRNCMPRSATSRAHGASSKGGKPHAIRIIGGDWKRTPLPVLDLDGLRPTPDRVRETLFNWLGQRLDGQRCSISLPAAARSASKRRRAAPHACLWSSVTRERRPSCGQTRNASRRA